ncbi:site-specific recombinase XerD [Desulfosporosinus orientis DSM 765]|uniref:Site-specific recombinase XerD n=1 Tax=Desulfosporosinus orientis (strain ATCC 19365 / DSM 765 / NCIMB 8382 / VKM B-1628 / Singapore I) TaxID=768706 RepID=G7WI40_DESOD|nr:site-specific recombinase XerD [Desulfosporosinus orientis DSM 765]
MAKSCWFYLTAYKPLPIENIDCLSVLDYVNLHDDFVKQKRVEGLSQRTLQDYKKHMDYFKKWLEEEQRLLGGRWLDKVLFQEYSAHMIPHGYAPNTINIRIRTFKTYLNWLRSEGYMTEDLASKVKYVKVPKDAIKPLSSKEIKRMLNLVLKGHRQISR